jgi:hypothetical protein
MPAIRHNNNQETTRENRNKYLVGVMVASKAIISGHNLQLQYRTISKKSIGIMHKSTVTVTKQRKKHLSRQLTFFLTIHNVNQDEKRDEKHSQEYKR